MCVCVQVGVCVCGVRVRACVGVCVSKTRRHDKPGK